MNEKATPDNVVPDYGSTLVWSNDDQRSVEMLLRKYNGDVDAALKRLFEAGGGTDYAWARQLSVRFANTFGLNEAEFMTKYRRWRRGVSLSG